MDPRNVFAPALLLGLLVTGAGSAAAIAPKQDTGPLESLAFISERLQVRPELEPIEEIEPALGAGVRNGWAGFRGDHGSWHAVIDRRHGGIEIAEGEGIPFIPGRGNQLAGTPAKPDLAALEKITRAFLPGVAPLLGIDPKSLVLNPGRSGQPADHLWFIDFDVVRDGIPIEGARVVFRVSHGNLIQFGSENLPSAGAAALRPRLTREQALANLSTYVGGFSAADRFLDGGSQRLLPVHLEDARFAEGYELGRGRGLTPAWQFIFRREGDGATWRARVDALTGEMLELVDTNDYAQVSGGARILGTSTNLPMPFTDISSGGFTNSAGVYDYSGGAITSALNGQYVGIADSCGAISQSADANGDIAFGTSAGTDCTTPGSGGAGNTHSARTQFYHLNRAKEAARGWLPANTWLSQKLTANVNINNTCNAFWNGATVNFYRSGGGCGNTGEIEGVSLHEYGHGLDSNDGNGGSPDRGTGETYGDWTAALATHSSCIGSGFRTSNCGGYGDACTSCTGVRDIDWAKHASNTPHTVANFTQAICPPSASYLGPCGKEGHCESYISSEALWDFVNRDLPSPGSGSAWATADRLWYLSRSTATAAFACTAGATYTSNGCNTGSLWKTLRAVDDDDGNLANGTPNSAALYAAFNRHGIACTSDAGASTSFRGCTQPAVPSLGAAGGDGQVALSWAGSTGVYDVYRNERGCNAGFIKIANDLANPSLVDTGVANGLTYYYQVVAQPGGNESCGSAPSTCVTATPAPAPCTPPAVPATVAATAAGPNQINLFWSPAAGASNYAIYRSTTSGGPYTRIDTVGPLSFMDTESLECGTTYHYVVRGSITQACQSANSAQVTVSTAPCGVCTTQSLYGNGFESGSGLADWTTGVFVAGGSSASWRGIQTCTANGGSKIFRHGGAGCTDDYTHNEFTFAQPGAGGGIAVPEGARTTRLVFSHRRSFESGFDGGTLTLSLDGSSYGIVPSTAILSGTSYNGSISAACPPAGAAGIPVFTGTASSFGQTVVDLDAACNGVTGGTGGCAGQALRIGFTSITDCSTTSDGWFLDDVAVNACVPTNASFTASDYYTLSPCRLVDTRLANAALGGPALQGGFERSFTVAGLCGIPATAKALALNITVAQAASGGYVQVYPGDGPSPITSAINFQTGLTRSNNTIVPLALDGSGTIKTRAGTTGPVHFILDVMGYFE